MRRRAWNSTHTQLARQHLESQQHDNSQPAAGTSAAARRLGEEEEEQAVYNPYQRMMTSGQRRARRRYLEEKQQREGLNRDDLERLTWLRAEYDRRAADGQHICEKQPKKRGKRGNRARY